MDFKTELTNQVEREVMACIGCNDCMLACPLPETSLVNIAELNAAIHESVISQRNVIQFVTACTQCRQCVPVCPADLSRADMVLFNKMKVEDATPDTELVLQIGQQVRRSGRTVSQLAQQLSQTALFADVAHADLRRVLLSVTLRQLLRGDVLCREGEFHERLYILLDGEVEQLVTTGEREARILRLGPGSFHGEMAVMADQPEQFTVRATQLTLVVEFPKTTVYRLMQLSETFRERMDSLYGQRAIWTHARKSPVLGALPEAAMTMLLNSAELVTYPAGTTLTRPHDKAEYLYLVRSGFLKVSRPFGNQRPAANGQPPATERVLLYLREGDTFGALPLLLPGRNHTVTLQTNTRAELIRIPGRALQRTLASYPQARNQLIATAMQAEKVLDDAPLTADKPTQARDNSTHLALSWTALLDKGVIQGHEVLVIDQATCTDCNNCVDACGRRHGYSRLQRSGLQLGNLLFPSACRHCEDPVCLLCSVNGIVRQPNGEISIVDDNCIGCGACAERCPYDNIAMHPVQTEKRRSNWLIDLFDLLKPRVSNSDRVGNFSVTDSDTPHLAVKCDLCTGYNDYACVTACPVGAAFRINPVEAFGRDDLLIGLEMKR